MQMVLEGVVVLLESCREENLVVRLRQVLIRQHWAKVFSVRPKSILRRDGEQELTEPHAVRYA
jgi:hypothetical protein